MNQESINRVELQGRIGMIRKTQVKDTKVASFSLRTEQFNIRQDGTATCETTWHNVAAFEDKDISIDDLEKDVLVNVKGRLRTSRYTAADGTEKTFTEILAHSLEIIR